MYIIISTETCIYFIPLPKYNYCLPELKSSLSLNEVKVDGHSPICAISFSIIQIPPFLSPLIVCVLGVFSVIAIFSKAFNRKNAIVDTLFELFVC